MFDVGFKVPPGGKFESTNHVLNDHTYCCTLSPSMCKSGEPDPSPENGEKCLKWHEKRLKTRSADATRLGIPLIISEFGACLDSEVCFRENSQVGDVCDAHLTSWIYWQFKTFKDLTTSAGDKSEGFYNKDGSI